MTLKERLRHLDIRIVDLSQMLGISRPTLYKIIEDYDDGVREKIDTGYLALFDYLMQDDVGKNAALSFIVKNIIDIKKPQESKQQFQGAKKEFVALLQQESKLDSILPYLIDCHKILSSPAMSDRDKERLSALREMYCKLNLNLGA